MKRYTGGQNLALKTKEVLGGKGWWLVYPHIEGWQGATTKCFCSCDSSADQLICNQGEYNPWHCCEVEIKYWVNTISGFWLQGSCRDVNDNKTCSSKLRRSLVKRYCQQDLGWSIGRVVKIMFITCSLPVIAQQQSYFKGFVTSAAALRSLFRSEVNSTLQVSMDFNWASLRTKHGWYHELSVWTPHVHMLLFKICNSASRRVRQLGEVHASSFFSRDSFFPLRFYINALVPMADEVRGRKKSHGYCYDFDIRIILPSLFRL